MVVKMKKGQTLDDEEILYTTNSNIQAVGSIGPESED
jgi:hypothetical protein